MDRILKSLWSYPLDKYGRGSQTARGQSNVDFVIALFILLVVCSAVVFAPGSPLLAVAQSGTDQQIDAQRTATELTTELGDMNGQLNSAAVEAIVDGSEPLDDYTSTADEIGVNITLYNPTLSGNSNASLLTDDGVRHAGEPIPEGAASSAVKAVRIDNRPVMLEVSVWRDT